MGLLVGIRFEVKIKYENEARFSELGYMEVIKAIEVKGF